MTKINPSATKQLNKQSLFQKVSGDWSTYYMHIKEHIRRGGGKCKNFTVNK